VPWTHSLPGRHHTPEQEEEEEEEEEEARDKLQVTLSVVARKNSSV